MAGVLPARELAGLAAIQRLSEEEKRIEEGCGCGHGSGPQAQIHARPHDAESPIVAVGQREREVTHIPLPPPPSSPTGEEEEVVTEEGMLMEQDDDEHKREEAGVKTQQQQQQQQQKEEEAVVHHHHHEHSADVQCGGEEEAVEAGSSSSMDVEVEKPVIQEEEPVVDPNVGQLVAMGFDANEAQKALRMMAGDVMRAADYLLNNEGKVSDSGGMYMR